MKEADVGGTRYNAGKTKWGLLSWPALKELVAVLEFGAQKYAAWNWSNGLSWSECFESLQRHLTAWYAGEDKDPETGLSHIAHVFCNAMFLMHFIIFKTGRDDRPTALRQGEHIEQIEVGGCAPAIYALESCRVPDVQANVRPAR